VRFRTPVKRGALARGAALVSPVLTALIEPPWYALVRRSRFAAPLSGYRRSAGEPLSALPLV
jgi:hypothetical protein